MKFRISALVAISAVLLLSCQKKDKVDDLQRQIDALKTERIAPVETQAANIEKSIGELQSTEECLKAFINAADDRISELAGHTEGREKEIERLNACLDTLKAADAEMLRMMESLKLYVVTQIGKYEDWASATFVTLEKYDTISSVVASVSAWTDYAKTFIQDGGAVDQCAEELVEAAESSQESMSKWVNEKFSSYYTIAQVEAAIDIEFFLSDSAAAVAILEQYKALEDMKSELTEEYKEAISKAISSAAGELDSKIDEVLDDLNERIDAVVAAIPGLEARLQNLELKMKILIGRIQSIVLASSTTGIAYVDKVMSFLDFEVTPASAAGQLVDLFSDYDELFSLSVFPSATKAADPIVLHVTMASLVGDTLRLKVNTNYLDEKFYSENPETFYNACLNINSPNHSTELSSKYFKLSFNKVIENDWFCITKETRNTTISFEKVGNAPDWALEYSTDGKNWDPFPSGTRLPDSLKAWTPVLIRNTGTNLTLTTDTLNYNHFVIKGQAKVSGDITYLLNGTAPITEFDPQTQKYAFARLFEKCDIADASALGLPCTVLSEGCYLGMFRGCANLTQHPVLGATTLAPECYREMFGGCAKLTTTPALSASVLAQGCYRGMFSGCAGLTIPPTLGATVLAQDCYRDMFAGCETMVLIPSLGAKTLVEGCYRGMFRDCKSLITSPDLSAKILVGECYREMFSGCSSLSYIVCLATDISAEDCTKDWVKGVASNGNLTTDWDTVFEEESESGCPKGWTIYKEDPVKKLLTGEDGSAKWGWAEDGANVWGNGGHTGNGSSYTRTVIDGCWWGVTSSTALLGDQMKHAAGDEVNAEKDAASGSYMVFRSDGTVASFTADGEMIREAEWELENYDPNRHNNWELAKLKTSDPVILWPYSINEGGKKVYDQGFDVMYLGDEGNMTLVYTKGVPAGGWGEITYWRFNRKAGDGYSVNLEAAGGKWMWNVDGNGTWGNAGHMGNGAGFTRTAVDGKWWGAVTAAELMDQLQHSGGVAYGDESDDAYMIFKDGKVTTYKPDGTEIRSGDYTLNIYPDGRNAGWELGKLKTSAPATMFPWSINEGGVAVTEFDVMYLESDAMTLVYTKGTTAGSWGEITWWRFVRPN